MSRATKSFGGVRHCSLRALLSNSFLNDHKLNKMQSALLPKKRGIGDCDGTRKAAKKWPNVDITHFSSGATPAIHQNRVQG
ncbi:unnamed protein product [Sphagnum troendelagicum]